jgi:hypothetical protein
LHEDGGGSPIRDNADLRLIGCGYPTEQSATEAAKLWHRRLTTALASIRVGANLGDRSFHATHVTPHGQAWLREQFDRPADDTRPIIGDRLGPSVFETASRPIFVTSTATGVVLKPSSILDAALVALTEAGYEALPAEQSAYDMYAISFFLPSPDARFIALMMAMEALINRGERSEETRALVDEFIAATKHAGLTEGESQSLRSGLADLKRESIGQAGRRLAATLAPRTYGHEPPGEFFARCYRIRSRLVHGDDDRPDLAEVNALGPHLERLVADLLSGPLLGLPDAPTTPPIRGIAMWGPTSAEA